MTEDKANSFELKCTEDRARVGRVNTSHGSFETPAFMPVGTQGTVKGLNPDQLRSAGAEIILSNTYHLHLRPGDELIRDLGGLHCFMAWSGPILTDSGGFQVYSLSKLRKLSEHGVVFQSHIDGSAIEFTPEKVVRIQENLGVDIMMVLDECLKYPAERSEAEKSLELTLKWARTSNEARQRAESQLFGIVQGGMFEDLRIRCCEELCEIGFDGYALGGLSVGESASQRRDMVECSVQQLPADRVRYLMGVGTPADILEAVALGIDMFDCVIPTRSARFGRIYSGNSFFNIRNETFRSDPRPMEEGCDCYACLNFSRAYIAHLMHAKEILGVQLASLHNVRFYLRFMERIRRAIREKSFNSLCAGFLVSSLQETP